MVTQWQYERQRETLGLQPSIQQEVSQLEAGEQKEVEEHYFVSHGDYVEKAVSTLFSST
jgi:hypothetical protein